MSCFVIFHWCICLQYVIDCSLYRSCELLRKCSFLHMTKGKFNLGKMVLLSSLSSLFG